ncbi:NAD-dependent succinate-semialdehyde dehydrogenase [Enteractinococcus coprophilus]|uniref:Succinate-semialdehyde dehydrogenase/glutarate-semialdehyde dehydrogenase n=1 Tax=Enteractinococcus coprophilus TaxID=1027633 RepID=A0A542ZZT0_9MICC|nr:NAD-dependent succinate-semialdehyde dehydrogenase [Enteractinococcus coprophilus]TQL65854.1 succinate-semialdehyde dehydrogenase/glutarate-semialdehyde dehydrogenase [Enteractinococcus coprophilus]
MTTTYRTQNPATGELVQEFPYASDDDIQQALTTAANAYRTWSDMPMAQRGQILLKLADLFEERAEELAAQATLEMGKNTREAIGEVKYCARIIRYYATEGERLAADQELKNIDGQTAILRRRPIGTILGIMPWNFPYYQVIRFAAPNLMLGNTVILKHAEICAGAALKIQELMHEAGVLEGAYINVFATHDQISTIIADPRIQGVSLTGSERAGSAVAEQAGRHLKKAVLELGGSDPYIVLDSADVSTSARRALFSRLSNSGQTCTSNKRIIVMDDIYDEFVAELTTLAAELTPGNPAEANRGEYAPLSSEAAAVGLMQQIEDARRAGATVHVGGQRPDLPGYYVAPTVLTDVPETARAYSEELFGPVVMIYRVNTEDEAIELANSSSYGLGGAVFSTDEARAQAVADRLEVGMVHINAFNVGGEDLPFGGVKRSGFGRELGPLGMDEFVNKQLITINTPR